jgi:hypothetical protein
MAEVKAKPKMAKEEAKLYEINRIETFMSEEDGCLYSLARVDGGPSLFFSSSSLFGDWLTINKVKLKDKLLISIDQGGSVTYADYLEE